MRQLIFSITSAARWPFTGSTTATPRPTSADLGRKCHVDPFVAGVATPAGSAALTSPGGGALCAATVRLRHGVAYFLSARQSWRPNATQTQHAYMHDTRAQACMCTLGDREVSCRARHVLCGGVARLAFLSPFFWPHKNGVGTLWPNLNRLSRLVPCGKGSYTLQ